MGPQNVNALLMLKMPISVNPLWITALAFLFHFIIFYLFILPHFLMLCFLAFDLMSL